MTLEIIMIDTIILCGKTDDAVDLAPTGAESVEGAKKHWKWIRKHIEHSTYVCANIQSKIGLPKINHGISQKI